MVMQKKPIYRSGLGTLRQNHSRKFWKNQTFRKTSFGFFRWGWGRAKFIKTILGFFIQAKENFLYNKTVDQKFGSKNEFLGS